MILFFLYKLGGRSLFLTLFPFLSVFCYDLSVTIRVSLHRQPSSSHPHSILTPTSGFTASFPSEEEMNHCAIQQGNALSACDDMRACSRDSVVCPKPRRFGLLSVTHNDPVRSLRWHLGHQAELYDSKAGSDILDILLPKGSFGVEPFSCTEIASPHPFFCGSPPSRVANPLIQDARFGDEKPTPLSPPSPTAPPLDLSSSPSSSARKGGFVRASFGNKPAVRVEGFDCLDRDRRNCSIPTLA